MRCGVKMEVHRCDCRDAAAHVGAHALGRYGCGGEDDIIAGDSNCATRFRACAVVRWENKLTARTFVKLPGHTLITPNALALSLS